MTLKVNTRLARTHSGLAVDPDVRKAYEMFMRDHRRMIGTLVHFSMIVFIVDKHMKSFYLECTNCSFEKLKSEQNWIRLNCLKVGNQLYST